MTPIDTVLAFLESINSGDAERVAAMLAENHVFIDALGRAVHGRETMKGGWRGYYAMCPGYRIWHHTMFASGNQVAVFGEAGGTIAARAGALPAENQWSTPAAWLAVVEDGLIREWRVYADNKPVYDILARTAEHA